MPAALRNTTFLRDYGEKLAPEWETWDGRNMAQFGEIKWKDVRLVEEEDWEDEGVGDDEGVCECVSCYFRNRKGCECRSHEEGQERDLDSHDESSLCSTILKIEEKGEKGVGDEKIKMGMH